MNANFPASRRGFGDESGLVKTKYWTDIGGMGISPDMLALTGFWPETLLNQLRVDGRDTSMAIEQVFGGVLKFKPLPGRKFEERLATVIDALNMILQVKRQINDLVAHIPTLLNEEWHDEDVSFLPKDLKKEIKDMIVSKRKYVIAEDPTIARQILAMVPQLKGLQNRIGYFPGIYREANTLFQRMVIESVSTSMANMSIRDSLPGPQYVELEEIADAAMDNIGRGDF